MPRRKLTEEEKKANKIAREKKKREDDKKQLLERSYKDCMKAINRGDVGEPTYFFKVGDWVEWGNWDVVDILEVLEGGKLYKCYKEAPDFAYGKYTGQRKMIDYALWPELRPYRAEEEACKNDRLEEDEDVHFSYMQCDIQSILYSIYGGSGLDLNPDYQRELVWTEEQKVSLIDSIFKNIDIGKFTIIRRSFREELQHYYEVLDGKQRIQALKDFYECRFKYKGLTYNDLHWRDRLHFTGYSISWAETEPLTDEQKYRYFIKLNVSGVPMSKKHLDKVYNKWLYCKKGGKQSADI